MIKMTYDEAQGKPCSRCNKKILGYPDYAEPIGIICYSCARAIYGPDD